MIQFDSYCSIGLVQPPTIVKFFWKQRWLEKIQLWMLSRHCGNAFWRSGVDPCPGWLWCSVEDQPRQWQSLSRQREGTNRHKHDRMRWGWSFKNLSHIFLTEAWKKTQEMWGVVWRHNLSTTYIYICIYIHIYVYIYTYIYICIYFL